MEEGRVELDGRSELEERSEGRSEQDDGTGQTAPRLTSVDYSVERDLLSVKRDLPSVMSVDYQLVAVVSCVFGGSECDWRDGEAEDGKPLNTHLQVLN